MNKFLKKTGLVVTTFNLLGIAVSAQEKPNILWIVADDLGTDLGCYNNKAVFTPNIDKLAKEGITFTQVHSVTPVSSPSRSSLVTGMYPVSIDCHQHRTRFRSPLPDGIQPIMEYFRKAGYYVTNGNGTKMGQPGKTDYNFEHTNTIYDGADWVGRKPGQPFFAQMQIHFPHRPFLADSEHPVNRQKVIISPAYPDVALTREDFAQYLESVQQVDKHVGKIMQRLEKEGLLENTIILFFGDQGRPMVRAKQFLYDEGTHTPFIIRFPDKKKAGTKVENVVSTVDIPATSLALAGIPIPPHMQGQDVLSKKRDYVFSTRDRMDETSDRIRSVRDNRFKYIRNYHPERPYTQFNTYKVSMYPVLTLMKVMYKNGELNQQQAAFMAPVKSAEELYDVVNDPFEVKNLATDPSYSKELKRMRQVLDAWVAQNDKGKYPEDTTETEYWKADAKKAFETKMKSYNLPTDISDEDFLKWWKTRLKVD